MSFEVKGQMILKPCLLVLTGMPLSGKTFLSKYLVESSNLIGIDVDVVRNEIDTSRKKDGRIGMLEPAVELSVMISAYQEVCGRAYSVISKRIPVVITGTFSREEFKAPLVMLLSKISDQGIPVKLFLLDCSSSEVVKRIEKRRLECGYSNIDSLEKFQWSKNIFQMIDFAPIVKINTDKPNYLEQVMQGLQEFEQR